MPTIHIQQMHGPATGRRMAFDQDALHFGRSSSADVVLTHRSASREHGRIVFEKGQWLLINEGRNATWVNGKRVAKKPHALQNHDVIQLGDENLFRVYLEATSVDDMEDIPETAEPRKQKFSSRQRLWIGIGAYLGVCLLGLVFAATLFQGGGGGNDAPVARLSHDQIRQAMRQPADVRAVNPTLAEERARQANAMYDRLSPGTLKLYAPWKQYKEALAYSGKDRFEDTPTQIKYLDLEERMIERVIEMYDLAVTTLQGGEYARAQARLQTLLDFYPDPESPVYQNVVLHHRRAVRRSGG